MTMAQKIIILVRLQRISEMRTSEWAGRTSDGDDIYIRLRDDTVTVRKAPTLFDNEFESVPDETWMGQPLFFASGLVPPPTPATNEAMIERLPVFIFVDSRMEIKARDTNRMQRDYEAVAQLGDDEFWDIDEAIRDGYLSAPGIER